MHDTMELDLPRADNPEPRVAVVLLLDRSGSMSTPVDETSEENGAPHHPPRTRIDELNAGLASFRADIYNDERARKRAEICTVSFGGDSRVDHDFCEAQFLPQLTLAAGGGTPMGEAILTGVDLVEARKAQYKQQGLDYFRSWVFLVTDGLPTDMERWAEATERSRRIEAERGASIFTVGTKDADMDRLAEVAVRHPQHLKGLSFREMFLWLSKSLSAVSGSAPVTKDPDAKVALELPTDWAEA